MCFSNPKKDGRNASEPWSLPWLRRILPVEWSYPNSHSSLLIGRVAFLPHTYAKTISISFLQPRARHTLRIRHLWMYLRELTTHSSNIRVSIRRTYFPQKPWISYETSHLNPLLAPFLTYRCAGSVDQTISVWMENVSGFIRAQNKHRAKKAHLFTISQLGEFSYVYRLPKLVWRQIDEIRQGFLVLPFAHVQTSHHKKTPSGTPYALVLRIFPQGPLILKLTASVHLHQFNKNLLSELWAIFRSQVKTWEPLFHTAIFSPSFLSKIPKTNHLLHLGGDMLSLTFVKETINTSLLTTNATIRYEPTPGVPFSFLLEVSTPSTSTTRELLQKTDMVIDWFNAYNAFLQWGFSHVQRAHEWSIHEWTYFYSLLMYCFNPNTHSRMLPGSKAFPNLLRTRLLRELWDLLANKSSSGISEWKAFLEHLQKPLNIRSLFLRNILDERSVLILDPLLANLGDPYPGPVIPPLLSCKEIAVLSFLVCIIIAYCTPPNRSNSFKTILAEKMDFEHRFQWAKRMSRTISRPFFKDIPSLGMVSPHTVRTYFLKILKTIPLENQSPLNAIYQEIAKSLECPSLDTLGWSPREFSPINGKNSKFSNLIQKRLVVVSPGKGATKNFVQANLDHSLVGYLIRKYLNK